MSIYRTHCYFQSMRELPETLEIDDSNAIVLHNYQKCCKEMHCLVSEGYIYGIEIAATDIDTANSIVDLLCASHTVVAGYNYEAPEEILS